MPRKREPRGSARSAQGSGLPAVWAAVTPEFKPTAVLLQIFNPSTCFVTRQGACIGDPTIGVGVPFDEALVLALRDVGQGARLVIRFEEDVR
jgi:hypothetical protein